MTEDPPRSSEGASDGLVVSDITDLPYTDRDDADAAVTRAFELLRAGAENIEAGKNLLAQAQRREAWKVLGFDSWNDLILNGVNTHLRHVLDPEVRKRLAIEMRTGGDGASTRQIAAAMDVSHVTIMRDLREARASGQLDEADEPHPTKPPRASPPAPRTPGDRRRADLGKTFVNHAVEIARRARVLGAMREDERYAEQLEDLLRTYTDLQAAHAILTSILEDFQAVASSGP